VGEIRRDQRRVLQEKRGLTSAACGLAVGDASNLRLFDEPDATELHSLIEVNRDELARWLPWAATQTLEDTRKYIEQARAQAVRDEALQLALVCDGRIAGAIGCVSIDWPNRSTGIGYWLAEEFQGRGTMSAAVRALAEHALRVWDLNRVEIRVATGNRRSRAIPERLGFREEGLLRQAQRIGDRVVDLAVYSMLADDSPRRS